MIITIEPGIYIPQDNIGIRIEDNILITDTGYQNLTQQAVKAIDDIQHLMHT